MGIFSKLFGRAGEKALEKDIAKEAESATEKALEKGLSEDTARGVGKGVNQGFSASTMLAVAALPVVGGFAVAFMTADTAKEVVDDLIDNPAALAVIAGVAFLILKR